MDYRLMEIEKNHTIKIMVVGPDNGLSSFLKEKLPETGFEIFHCIPGANFIGEARRAQIAVFDRIHERTENARQEISMLKENNPKLPIIAISEHSTGRDADVVNQGVFYYLAGYSGQKLLRVIRAAADSIESRNELEKQ